MRRAGILLLALALLGSPAWADSLFGGGSAGSAGPAASIESGTTECDGGAVGALLNVLAGGEIDCTDTSPPISDFTDAQHDHEDANDGGQIDSDALSAAVSTTKGGTGQDWDSASGIPRLSAGTFSLITEGTANRLTKWCASDGLCTSLISEDGTNVTLTSGDLRVPNGSVADPTIVGTTTNTGICFGSTFVCVSVAGVSSFVFSDLVLAMGAAKQVTWSASHASGAADLLLGRDAAATLKMGTNATSGVVQTVKSHDITSTTNVAAPAMRVSTGAGRGDAATQGVEFHVSIPTTSGTGAQTVSEVASVVPGGIKLESDKALNSPDACPTVPNEGDVCFPCSGTTPTKTCRVERYEDAAWRVIATSANF